MDAEVKLLPCPFCGGEGSLNRHGGVLCAPCDVTINVSVWNRRAKPALDAETRAALEVGLMALRETEIATIPVCVYGAKEARAKLQAWLDGEKGATVGGSATGPNPVESGTEREPPAQGGLANGVQSRLPQPPPDSPGKIAADLLGILKRVGGYTTRELTVIAARVEALDARRDLSQPPKSLPPPPGGVRRCSQAPLGGKSGGNAGENRGKLGEIEEKEGHGETNPAALKGRDFLPFFLLWGKKRKRRTYAYARRADSDRHRR